jgi:hypothetical protein
MWTKLQEYGRIVIEFDWLDFILSFSSTCLAAAQTLHSAKQNMSQAVFTIFGSYSRRLKNPSFCDNHRVS